MKSEISIGAASLETGVEKATIRRWVAWYKAEGDKAFETAEKYRAYSPELKRQAVEAYLAGEGSQIEIATKYHLRSDKEKEVRWKSARNTSCGMYVSWGTG